MLLSALVPFVAPTQLAPNYHRLQPPANSPKVVFIGDYITYEWASAFAANPPRAFGLDATMQIAPS
jgi:hypothetical protein